MAEIHVPLSITYDTKGLTPINDVIAALQAASVAIEDAISLIPSLKAGVYIESSHINVRSITQESPLRELFALTLLVAFQDDLKAEIPPMVDKILGVDIPDQYDSLVTVTTMIVLFYGASFLKEAAVKAVENGALKRQVAELISQMSKTTGKSEEEVRAIFDAKYGKPGTVKRLAKAVKGFFVPSQREGGVPVTFDRQIISREVIREVPYPQEFEEKEDFERYTPYRRTHLEIHAQDRDKLATGWAAVPTEITAARLRMKLVEPVSVADLWTKEAVVADIVVVSKLTADGYKPSEIHLTRVYDEL
jgi:hypothetical protein